MAFSNNNLSVLSYANGFTLWHYVTTDTAATVDTSGYFNNASDVVRVGDIVIANADTAGTPATGLMLISSNDNGVVDVDDMTGIGGTDTD
ncbi:MAG: hypothetical protein KAJ75_07215 [Alphaproteobacteria bacterium]|nr:hypothetical protein [Alphaproteobacteria bacterium]